MLGEFARRLLVALPVICLLAVLAILLLRRSRLADGRANLRGLFGGRLHFAPASAAAPALELRGVRPVTPASRLAVVRFDGRDFLVGVSAQSFTLLASGAARPDAEPPQHRQAQGTQAQGTQA